MSDDRHAPDPTDRALTLMQGGRSPQAMMADSFYDQPLPPLPQVAARGVHTLPCYMVDGAWTIFAVSSAGRMGPMYHATTAPERNGAIDACEEWLRTCDALPGIAPIRVVG